MVDMRWKCLTSRTRARRAAEVSRFEDRDAIGSKDKVCGPSQLLNSVLWIRRRFASPLFELWPKLLNSSQTISALLIKVVPSLPTSAQLFSPLPCSCQLFSTTLTSAHLVLTLLDSFSTRLNSHLLPPLSTLPTSSHLRSTHLTFFSAHLNSSHLLNSGQLFSTLLASCHRAAYTQSKLWHGEKFTHSKLLHREALIHRSFYTTSFYTQQAFAQRSFCTEQAFTEKLLHREAFSQSKLLHREAFTHSKLLHRGAFTQSELLRREAFTHGKLLHREGATQDAPKMRNICCQSTIRNFHAATTFYDLRFSAAKDIKSIRTQPQQRGTWTQPFHCHYSLFLSPATGHRPPATPSITAHRPLATSHRPAATGHRLPHRSPPTGHWPHGHHGHCLRSGLQSRGI